eukprot:m.380183 g.380183  ORF g.380183 m.380183 type:complete len:53 (-) comp56224_c0_seq8:539-697(-)
MELAKQCCPEFSTTAQKRSNPDPDAPLRDMRDQNPGGQSQVQSIHDPIRKGL